MIGGRVPNRGWKRPFDDPITLPGGRELVTLQDAGTYIMKLPKAEHEAPERQAAMEALILVATSGGPTMLARIGVVRALNRHVERVFELSGKKHHWGNASWRATDGASPGPQGRPRAFEAAANLHPHRPGGNNEPTRGAGASEGPLQQKAAGGLTSPADFPPIPCRGSGRYRTSPWRHPAGRPGRPFLDGRNMDENVLAAAIRRDEAITLLAVKPFHCPTRHVALPSQ
jgi:hypothetical protein